MLLHLQKNNFCRINRFQYSNIVVLAKNTTCIYGIKLFTNVSASTSCSSMQLEAVENGNIEINEMK